MIVIKSFKELDEKYANKEVPRDLFEHIYLLKNDEVYKEEDTAQSFDWLFGGNFHICETADDLIEVKGCDLDYADDNNGEWPNITSFPQSWDICDYVNPEWGVVAMMWNDAGGPTYYIPKDLFAICKFDEHVRMTKEYWNHADKKN